MNDFYNIVIGNQLQSINSISINDFEIRNVL